MLVRILLNTTEHFQIFSNIISIHLVCYFKYMFLFLYRKMIQIT